MLAALIAAPLAACGGTEIDRAVGAGGSSGPGQPDSGGSVYGIAGAKQGGGGTGAAQGDNAGLAGAIQAGNGPRGVPYPCLGGFVLERAGTGGGAGAAGAGGEGSEGPIAGAAGADPGETSAPPVFEEIPWTGAVSGSASCIVGESYCHIESPNEPGFFAPVGSCVDLSGSLAACSDTPNCECLCSHGTWCHTECSCTDNSDGVATVSCFPI